MYIDLPEKRYYKISEVANAFQVNISKIRYWTDQFDTIKPKTNAKGDRFYTHTDIEAIKLVFHLVEEKGLTLEGARKSLKNKPKETVTKHQIISRLEVVKEELLKIKNNL